MVALLKSFSTRAGTRALLAGPPLRSVLFPRNKNASPAVYAIVAVMGSYGEMHTGSSAVMARLRERIPRGTW